MYRKQLPFEYLGKTTMVVLHVGHYEPSGRLSIELLQEGLYGLEPIARMTVNLPVTAPLEANEAFIDNALVGDDVLRFIEDNSLGKELTVPYENYKAVAFNMDKLYEYDPDGVTAFMLRQFRL